MENFFGRLKIVMVYDERFETMDEFVHRLREDNPFLVRRIIIFNQSYLSRNQFFLFLITYVFLRGLFLAP